MIANKLSCTVTCPPLANFENTSVPVELDKSYHMFKDCGQLHKWHDHFTIECVPTRLLNSLVITTLDYT